MAKQVYKSHEIPHLWAYRTQENARNPQGNFSFSGELLISYRTPIARRMVVKRKENGKIASLSVFLIIDHYYSSTTSKQQSEARGATYGEYVFYNIADVGDSRVEIDHKANLNHYADLIDKATRKLARARAHTVAEKIGELTRLVNEANKYAELFHSRRRFSVPTQETAQETLKRALLRESKESKAQAIRMEQARKANEIANAKRMEKARENLPKWLNGEDVDISNIKTASNRDTDYVRIEGEELVSNRGARVPLHHAKRAIAIVRNVMEKGEDKTFEPDKSFRLGHYTINRIDGVSGMLWVGCHNFDRQEIERIYHMLASLDIPTPPAE